MKLSKDYGEFYERLNSLHPKYGTTPKLPLPEPRPELQTDLNEPEQSEESTTGL
jgi:hypothetical protein